MMLLKITNNGNGDNSRKIAIKKEKREIKREERDSSL